MADWTEVGVALCGVIPFAAFAWIAVGSRKRLGYSVLMDTLSTDAAPWAMAGSLRIMSTDSGEELRDTSLVLLRIENAGWQPISADD
ncbi:hypothetical protein ACFY5C_24505 [Streptomyces sp. NPDC012935]|uniref:hypothetical protein n=1 Tax=Streptomyces sp. NPDC012935 TaxID=3364857 RepID=UPI0036BDF4F8